jgi:hypothetical protein
MGLLRVGAPATLFFVCLQVGPHTSSTRAPPLIQATRNSVLNFSQERGATTPLVWVTPELKAKYTAEFAQTYSNASSIGDTTGGGVNANDERAGAAAGTHTRLEPAPSQAFNDFQFWKTPMPQM